MDSIVDKKKQNDSQASSPKAPSQIFHVGIEDKVTFLRRSEDIVRIWGSYRVFTPDEMNELPEKLYAALALARIMVDREPLKSALTAFNMCRIMARGVAANLIQQAVGIYRKQCSDSTIEPELGTRDEQNNAQAMLRDHIFSSIDDPQDAERSLNTLFITWMITEVCRKERIPVKEWSLDLLGKIHDFHNRNLKEGFSFAYAFVWYYFTDDYVQLWAERLNLASLSIDEIHSLIVCPSLEAGEMANRESKDGPSSATRRFQFQTIFPQQTSMESLCATIAIADGPTLRGWMPITGEVAMRHAVDNAPLQARITPGLLPQWLAIEPDSITYENLERVLRTFNTSTLLLYHFVVDMGLAEQRVTATIDSLIKLLGWSPRSVAERREQRERVGVWMQAFHGITVHGKRKGQFRDRLTKEVIDVSCKDPILVITGQRLADQQQMNLDHSEVPMEVSWVVGEFFDHHRDDKRVLQHFGNVRKLAGLPIGKTSGAWAQSIGLVLNQNGVKCLPAWR
jgi:hypothetical protein